MKNWLKAIGLCLGSWAAVTALFWLAHNAPLAMVGLFVASVIGLVKSYLDLLK